MKRFVIAFLTVCMLLALCGCNSGSTVSGGADAGGGTSTDGAGTAGDGAVDWSQVKFGLTMATDSFSYFIDFRQGLVDAVTARGGQVIDGVVAGQAADIQATCESFALQGCQLIVDFNQLPEVYESGYAQQLLERGINVVEIDQIMEEPVYFVGGDQYEQGQVQSNYVCDWIDENWGGECDYVVLFYNQSSGEAQWNRQYATEAVVKERLNLSDDQIFWFDQNDTGDTVTSSMQKTRDFLTSHPNSKVYICSHSDIQAIGIYSAVEQLGMEDHVVIGSHDGSADTVAKIKELNGKCLVTTAFCDNLSFGEQVCKLYEQIVAGTAEHLNPVACVAITAENADEFLN